MNFYDAGDEDNFYTRLMGFEQSCMEEADPMFFREPAVFSVLPLPITRGVLVLVSECDPQRRVPGGHGRRRRCPFALTSASGRSRGKPSAFPRP